MDTNSRPTHRRSRSLDLTDSLNRIEQLRKRRQQFLEDKAKYNQNENPNSVSKPYLIKSSPFPPSNEVIKSANSLPIPDSTASNDMNVEDENQGRSITPISELIQKFTAEMLNFDSNQSQSQEAKESSALSLDAPKVDKFYNQEGKTDSTQYRFQFHATPPNPVYRTKQPVDEPNEEEEYSSGRFVSTAVSFISPNSDRYSSPNEDRENRATLRRPFYQPVDEPNVEEQYSRSSGGFVSTAVPFISPNSDRYSSPNEERENNQVTLRRPSEFLEDENVASLPRPSSLGVLPVTETGKSYKTSLHMSITSPEIFQSINNKAKLDRRTEKLNSDETDSRTTNSPSWIPLSQNSKRGYSSPIAAPYRTYTRSSSFQNNSTEDSSKNSWKAQGMNIHSPKNLNSDETDSRTTNSPSWIPLSQNSKREYSSPVTTPHRTYTRSSSLQNNSTEDTSKSSWKAQGILSPKNLNSDETDSRTTNSPSWIPLSQNSKREYSSPISTLHPTYTRSSTFQNTSSAKDSSKTSFKAKDILSPKKVDVDDTDSRTSDSPSWLPLTQDSNEENNSVPRTYTPLFRSSSYQSTPQTEKISDTVTDSDTSSFVSERQHFISNSSEQNIEESVEIRKHSDSSTTRPSSKLGDKYIEAVQNPKMIRRSSSSSINSFVRRSQTPTVPVKSLVQKYSSKSSK